MPIMGRSKALPESPLRGRRVLIVEDELLVAMEIEGLLQRQGCTVVGPAPTAGRVLALLDQEKPHAALLDLNPNGESASPIAAELAEQGVPFVVVTGYGNAQSHDPALRHAPCVDKPFRHRDLLRVLTRQLEAASSG
jgi:DNA-binding NtrC family response regulator